jgi:hypothetical protein
MTHSLQSLSETGASDLRLLARLPHLVVRLDDATIDAIRSCFNVQRLALLGYPMEVASRAGIYPRLADGAPSHSAESRLTSELQGWKSDAGQAALAAAINSASVSLYDYIPSILVDAHVSGDRQQRLIACGANGGTFAGGEEAEAELIHCLHRNIEHFTWFGVLVAPDPCTAVLLHADQKRLIALEEVLGKAASWTARVVADRLSAQ